MRFELIAALCFCFILQCQAKNIFSSFFGGGSGEIPPSPSSSENQDCVVESITNANGEVVARRCVPPSSSSGNGARAKRQAPSPRNKIDLLIMLDDSGGIGRENFEKVKRIAAAIIKLLCGRKRLGRDYTRVAIMSFSSTTYIHKYPLSYGSRRELDRDANRLAQFIMNIFYRGGPSTCLIQALQEGYQTTLHESRGGRRHLPDVEQDIIVISDGCENCVAVSDRKNRIREMITNFRNNNVNIYVIGVGLTNHCKASLNILAQGGHCYHFFFVAPWDLTVEQFLFQLENPPSGFCFSAFEHPSKQCVTPTI